MRCSPVTKRSLSSRKPSHLICRSQSEPVQQSSRRVSQAEGARPLHKWQRPAIPQHKPVGSLKPYAAVILYAVRYLRDADNPSCLKLCGLKSVLTTCLAVNVQRGVDQKRTSVFCRPSPILDILRAVNDQVSPGLPYGQNFHGHSPLSRSTSLCFEKHGALFVGFRGLRSGIRSALARGDRVSFDVAKTSEGRWKACNIVLLDVAAAG